MTKCVFIWSAHPKQGSLSEAIADAYQKGASNNGNSKIRRNNLSEMSFNDSSFTGYDARNVLEPDLKTWQENIEWADHLLFVYPYWWGGMPAQAKSVIDKALTPGFAFKYKNKGLQWDKLLATKTADVIITSDTPPLIDTLLYRKPARRVIKNQVLGFCGIKTKNILQFGSVKTATPRKIDKWILRAERLGFNVS